MKEYPAICLEELREITENSLWIDDISVKRNLDVDDIVGLRWILKK
jgi:hypothetical protein